MKWLSDQPLSDGTKIRVAQNENMGDCPAVATLLRGFADILDKGWAVENLTSFSNSNKVIWCQGPEGDVVGATMFTRNAETSHLWIMFSYVVPEWRQKGVNRLMNRFIEIDARANKLKYIGSMVHPDNEARLKAMEKFGYSRAMIRMHKVLK